LAVVRDSFAGAGCGQVFVCLAFRGRRGKLLAETIDDNIFGEDAREATSVVGVELVAEGRDVMTGPIELELRLVAIRCFFLASCTPIEQVTLRAGNTDDAYPLETVWITRIESELSGRGDNEQKE
jgi:hypothetical protein